MSSPFLGEIRLWGCNFAPFGWAMCQGQILSIQQYTALFSLIGTYYGGNGTSNFALPDLRSRVALKYGTDRGGNQYVIGEQAGVENVTISQTTMPAHTHAFVGTSSTANALLASNDILASGTTTPFYAADSNTLQPLAPGALSTYQGGGQPHTNIQPYLALNYCIALIGIYPARN